MNNQLETSVGRPLPLGAHARGDGTYFSVFSRNAVQVNLCLFSASQDGRPHTEIVLDPELNRTGDIWHIFVKGTGPGQHYLYRVDGPFEPKKGHRFNPNLLLIDPYARALSGDFPWDLAEAHAYDPKSSKKDLSFSVKQDVTKIPKCIVIKDDFDWQGDKPLNYPLRFSVIYETHVRSLTMHSSCPAKYRGTYKGVIEMIPYFQELGITSLEFLPMQDFDELEINRNNPITGERLQNYWGYSTLAFFSPKASYSSGQRRGEQVSEFKEMVRELHKAGIEVILDVVFNHTGEGNEFGPTISMRGFDNSIYYLLDKNKRHYKNYSGCGNTLNCNHPMVRSFILDCLHYWVIDMHVDGFRFDLGSILGRDRQGKLMENPPILERIAEDPVLRNTKIIAEAWDVAGAYQVGSFPGGRWAEWNDRFRNDVRRFWRGDPSSSADLATRITGSSDLYLRDGRKPFHSINFITSHDGFTLNDLVSYEKKHNEENAENNHDGNDYNLSCNYGAEGETEDHRIEEVRNRQIKNFLATLILSLGTPMILGGDEFRRTQRGNNNAYCQNSEISWYDWRFKNKYRDVFEFCKELIHFRSHHPAFHRPEFYTGNDNDYNAIPDITWYDENAREIAWERADHLLSLQIDGSHAEIQADQDDNDFFFMFNASVNDVLFSIPKPPPDKHWYLAIDTAGESPFDHANSRERPPLTKPYKKKLMSRSMVVLISD